jgi:hypothetical protein
MVAFLPWEGAIGPFLLVEHRMHHPPTSCKFTCSGQSVWSPLPLEMRLSTVLEHDESKGDLMETHAMTIGDKSASKTAFWKLSSKVAKHIQLTGRRKFRKSYWFKTKPMRDVWRIELFRRLDLWGELCSRRVQFGGNAMVLNFELYWLEPASLSLNS